MPTTTITDNDSNKKVGAALLKLAKKAWRSGGGHGVGKPGSRGGHPWTDSRGNVRYGPQPKGGHSASSGGKKPQAVARHTSDAHVAANRARVAGAKPKINPHAPKLAPGSLAATRLRQTKMLEELMKVHRTGLDPHGNKLDPKQLAQVSTLITALRIQTHPVHNQGVGKKKEIAVDQAPGHTGVMVAFYVDTFSPDAAVKLQIPGGETWDALHLTLAYLGDFTQLGSDVESKLYQLISEFAAGQSVLEGTVSGIGLFNTTEEGDNNAFYASFDSPSLPAFRAQLIDLLQSNGVLPVQNHGFTPHITLAYIPKGLPIPNVELPEMPIIFSKITVKWGDKRTDFSIGYVTKEVSREISQQAAAHLPFTVFKDAKGRWRWVGVSSSAAQDHDGETVSLKALQDDTATKDITGTHGPLNWWHSHIKLGTCDFNAMDGPLLVESGTFVSDRVAVSVSKAISEGNLKPAMSLEFEHNEPGPPVLPGRVFMKINKVGRALLPAEKASNLLTSFKVYSLKNTSAALADEKGSKKMLTEEKQKKALEIFGPDLLEALSNDNQVAVKMAEALNLSFKAMAPAAVVETPAPEPTPAPVVNQAAIQATPDQPVEGAPEDGGDTIDPAALFESLTQTITAGVLAGLSTQQATATKETADALGVMTLALKENTTALNKVVDENVALKARLDALEGLQPPAVRARVTQGQGVTADQLPAVHKELVNQEEANKNKDPYAWASSLVPGLMSAPRG